MPIIPWECAHGDAAPATLAVAATVEIAPPDDSVDTNNVVIQGTGTISSFGTDAPLITKNVTFVPTGGSITLINSTQLALLGAASRTFSTRAFGTYSCDGAGHWQETSFTSSALDITAPSNLFKHAGSNLSLLNQSAAQPIFPGYPTFSLSANAAYHFNGFLYLQSAGSILPSLSFGGSITVASIFGSIERVDQPDQVAFVSMSGSPLTVSSGTHYLRIEGSLRTGSTAGTFQPQIGCSYSPGTLTNMAGSWFELVPLGAATTVGDA